MLLMQCAETFLVDVTRRRFVSLFFFFSYLQNLKIRNSKLWNVISMRQTKHPPLLFGTFDLTLLYLMKILSDKKFCFNKESAIQHKRSQVCRNNFQEFYALVMWLIIKQRKWAAFAAFWSRLQRLSCANGRVWGCALDKWIHRKMR